MSEYKVIVTVSPEVVTLYPDSEATEVSVNVFLRSQLINPFISFLLATAVKIVCPNTY